MVESKVTDEASSTGAKTHYPFPHRLVAAVRNIPSLHPSSAAHPGSSSSDPLRTTTRNSTNSHQLLPRPPWFCRHCERFLPAGPSRTRRASARSCSSDISAKANEADICTARARPHRLHRRIFHDSLTNPLRGRLRPSPSRPSASRATLPLDPLRARLGQ